VASPSARTVPCIALPVWCSTRSFEPVDHYERATDTKAALAYADAFFTEATRLNKTGGFKIRPRHIERAPLQWQALVRAHGVRIIWQYVFFRGGARWVDGGSPFAAVAGSVGLAPDGGGE